MEIIYDVDKPQDAEISALINNLSSLPQNF
jgi:hypothetical protein